MVYMVYMSVHGLHGVPVHQHHLACCLSHHRSLGKSGLSLLNFVTETDVGTRKYKPNRLIWEARKGGGSGGGGRRQSNAHRVPPAALGV
jgi:hypothetical protein